MVYLSRKESVNEFIQTFNDLRDRKLSMNKFKTQLKEEYNYELDDKTESEVSSMCNFSQYVREEAKIEERLETLQKRMKKHNFTLKEAMEDLDYDLKDYEFYKKELNVIA